MRLEGFFKAPLTTWQFLHYLSKSILEYPILILLTIRKDGKVRSSGDIPPYADVLQRLNREGLLIQIRLNRLTLEKSRQILHTIFPKSDFSHNFVEDVHQSTGGILQHLNTLLLSLIKKGFVYQQNRVWFNRDSVDKELMLQELHLAAKDVPADEYFKRLEAPKKDIIRVIALSDSTFSFRELIAILGLKRIQLLRYLDSLVEDKILIANENNQFGFKKGYLKNIALSSLNESQRKELHRQIAMKLEPLLSGETDPLIFQIANHYHGAREVNKAIPFLIRAGDLALQNYAFSEASHYYNVVFSYQDQLKDIISFERLIQLYGKLAWLDRVNGNWHSALKKCQDALRMCNSSVPKWVQRPIKIQMGLTFFRMNDWKKAIEILQGCLHQNEEELNDNEKALIYYGLGNVYLELSEYDQSRSYYQEALTYAQQANFKHLQANLLNNLGIIENITGNSLKSIGLYSRCIPIYKELGDNFGLAHIYNNIGMTYAEEKSWQKANEFYGKSLRLSDTEGFTHLKSITFLNRAIAFLNMGDIEEAREYNFKALRLVEKLKDHLGMAEYYKIQGMIEREVGNYPTAKNHFDLAYHYFRNYKNKLGMAEVALEKAILARAESDTKALNTWVKVALKSYNDLKNYRKVEEIMQMFNRLQFVRTVASGSH